MARTFRTLSVIATASLLIIGMLATAAQAQGRFVRLNEATPQGVTAPADTADTAVARRSLPAAPAPTADEIIIAAGQDVAAVMAAHPAGSAFRLASGTHHADELPVQAGDTLTGDRGAILDGTTRLTSFTAAGATWRTAVDVTPFTTDGTPNGPFHGETLAGFERDAANHDVWIDGQRARHVGSPAAVTAPDTFFLDYTTGTLTIAANPATSTVELTTAMFALNSDVSDVTVQYLTVRRFASPAQFGAINAGPRWTLRHLVIADNHGGGVKLTHGNVLEDSVITNNGQIGVTSWEGDGIVVRRNELSHNLALGYNWEWEGGATKFKHTVDALVTENWVHSNNGPGIWFDVNNVDATISRNVVEGNDWAGVVYEISYGALIVDNTIRHNGHGAFGDLGAGIWISNSNDVEVTENVVHDNRIDVIAVHDERGSGIHGRWVLTGLNVHHNLLGVSEVKSGLRVRTAETHLYAAEHNTFAANTYHVDSPTQVVSWWNGDKTIGDLQAAGHENGGSAIAAALTPLLPSGFQTAFAGI